MRNVDGKNKKGLSEHKVYFTSVYNLFFGTSFDLYIFNELYHEIQHSNAKYLLLLFNFNQTLIKAPQVGSEGS
jgi:hypothetical protein